MTFMPYEENEYIETPEKLDTCIWSWAVERLTSSRNYFAATVRPDGRPHSMPVWGVWLDDAFWFNTGGESRKAKNLAANAHCIMFDGLRATSKDKGVTWLPLFHDMGLIGFVVAPLFAQVQVMFLPTMNFIRRPGTWLDAIDRFLKRLAC